MQKHGSAREGALTQGNLHVQVADYEGPGIGGFFDLLGDGLARSVTGFGFDADQNWRGPRLISLQRRGKFEAVPRDYTIIVVGSGNERRRILGSGLQVVEWRVSVERFEHLRIIGGTIVRGPRPAD